MHCLICEKAISILEDMPNPVGAGTLTACFGYGSGHDQLGARSIPMKGDAPRLDKLLSCDRIRAWICDDCFEKKHHLFQGFEIKKTVEEVRKV